MKVTARNLQPEALDRMYKAALQMEDGKIEEKEAVEMRINILAFRKVYLKKPQKNPKAALR